MNKLLGDVVVVASTASAAVSSIEFSVIIFVQSFLNLIKFKIKLMKKSNGSNPKFKKENAHKIMVLLFAIFIGLTQNNVCLEDNNTF